MRRILIDTNVLLDVLLSRDPWVTDAARLWAIIETGKVAGYVCASTFTDIFYVARRLTDLNRARMAVRLCLDTFEVCAIDKASLELAEQLPGRDFEDNLQLASATQYSLDAIVTRDADAFKGTLIPVVSPVDFLASIAE
ncbi:MAG: PIN domain-containing protein [Caldilineaceae bacterium]|nr:PIN domain-containing protein [Caldilineaceae bacterium]